MKIQKIVIVGNSVALRNRPHNNLTSQNYGQIIEKKLNEDKQDEIIQVKNLAFTRAMVYDLHKVYPQIINNYGDLYIINIGRTIDLKTKGRSKGRHIATIRKSEMIIIGQVNGCILYLIITKTVFKILKTSIEIPVDNAAPTISYELMR